MRKLVHEPCELVRPTDSNLHGPHQLSRGYLEHGLYMFQRCSHIDEPLNLFTVKQMCV
jgi:hypothetical protein